MNVFLMIIVYVLMNGQAKMEQQVYTTEDACQEAVAQRATALQLDEKVLGMVVAGCGKVPGQEAKKETR